ncbi:MAG TPA: SPOR domain-containing protein [Gemmatimonadaceae bacterium]|nr:SPOR domain-containing protein [Gemmatimonadaceae bacterium]
MRIYAYPKLDSVVWTSTDPAPSITRVLAFDEEAGLLSFVDAKGIPARVDFRLDNVAIATRTRLTGLSSVDGATIYGLTKDGALLRSTPSGDWTFKPPRPARAAVPLSDGALLLIGSREKSAIVWRLRPPDTKILDSAEIPGAAHADWAQAGDRLYFTVERNLVGVRTRDLKPLNVIELDGHVRALVATPSGDRIFVLTDSSQQVDVIDRYREKVSEEIALPGIAEDLRIDPLGRYLLARAAAGDSMWVVNVGTDKLVGAARTAWRDDLPFVALDGAIALAQGKDVVFVEGPHLHERRRVPQGAADYWFSFAWSGFRPRAAALDQPVRFPGADSADSAARANADTSHTAPPPVPVDTTPTPSASKGWVVSFAALLNEEKAHELAATIKVHNETARVMSTPREGQTIYRVVLGPYPTKDEAERVGRDSKQNYWVYEATP